MSRMTKKTFNVEPSLRALVSALSKTIIKDKTMESEHVKGAANKLVGKAKKVVSDAIGDKALALKGKAQQVKGSAQKAVGDVKDAVE